MMGMGLTAVLLLPLIQVCAGGPLLVPLRREVVPVMKGGRAVSHRQVLFGDIQVGRPVAQEFSVVFDTGSGHAVVPAEGCRSAACVKRRRYRLSKSTSGFPVNADGEEPVDRRDELSIGFGTGTLTGEFVREVVCVGQKDRGEAEGAEGSPGCAVVDIVTATEMSSQPFESFGFDGIFGLGLGSLSIAPSFSFFGQLFNGANTTNAQFGIYLTGDEREEGSELAVAGHNAARLQEPLSWVPVVAPKLGHWLVEISGIRIGDETLEVCKHGGCRGIVDTGSSHLGVPQPFMAQLFRRLSAPLLSETSTCRDLSVPPLTLDLAGGFSLALDGRDYLRELPTVDVAPSKGQAPSQTCRPRLTPVKMPELGKNLFILGEPILRRYYTAFNWHSQQVGFGLAAHAASSPRPSIETAGEPLGGHKAVYLVQGRVRLFLRGAAAP